MSKAVKNNVDKETITKEYRNILAKTFEDSEIIKSKNNEGIIFYANTHTSAIHSEPKIDSDRIFISILPGTKKEIMDLKDRFTKSQKGGGNYYQKYLKYKKKYLDLKTQYSKL